MRLVDRIVDILYCLESSDGGLAVTEVAQRIGLPISTTYRLLQALVARELAAEDQYTQRYTLGLGALRMVSSVLRQRNLFLGSAQGPMERLRDLSGETVCLYMLFGIDRVCVRQVESTHGVRFTQDIGKPLPSYCGASGKLLLAFQPEQVMDRALSQPMERFTPLTVTDPVELRRQLQAIRSQGYAISFGERTPLVSAIAAPVKDGGGQLAACVTIYGPRMRLDDQRIASLLPELLETAGSISRAITPSNRGGELL